MKIDAHNHIGEKKGLKVTVEKLISDMDEAGIGKAIVFSFPEQINNQYILESVNNYSERLYGLATINPWQSTADNELETLFKNPAIVGLKLHPVKHGYTFDDHQILDSLFRICEKHNKFVLAFGGANVYSSPNMFEEMATTFPNVALLMAHGGQMYETKSAIGVAKRNKNVFIETSSMFALRVENLLIENLIDQIIFGSDTPYGDFNLEVEKINLVEKNQDNRDKIFYKNILNLIQGGD